MRQFYILPLILLFAISAGFSQGNFNLQADTLKYWGPADDTEHKNKTFAVTELDSLVLSWEVISLDQPEGWWNTLCDNYQCYADVTEGFTKTSQAIDSESPGLYEAGFTPNGIAGEGYMSVKVYEEDDQENADTVVFIYHAGLSIEKNTPETKFEVYPNPATSLLKIEFEQPLKEEIDVKIFNLLGQEQKRIYSRQEENTIKIDVRNLNNGTYLIQFVDPKGKMTTQRFTKKR